MSNDHIVRFLSLYYYRYNSDSHIIFNMLVPVVHLKRIGIRVR